MSAATKPKATKSSATKPKIPLKRVNTWVRIRPIGKLGHSEGQPVEKQLGSFDESAIKIISHDKKEQEDTYDYMSKVFPVDCTQEDVANATLPGLLEDFWSDRNAVIFAYGQTGTGKTHTMFGVANSLSSTSEDPGWGMLPRAVHATLRHIDERAAEGIRSVLLLSAVEFYCYQAYDLANKAGKQMCSMKGSRVIGNSYQHCDSPAILAQFLKRVYGNRNVAATAMNDGSSRSHCAITLTLMTLDGANKFKQTEFSVVDLAGAERPTKASHTGTRISKSEAMMQLYTWYKKGMQGGLSIGLQGFLINFELSGLLNEVVVASDLAKRNRPYKNRDGFMGGSATAFLGGALVGDARLGALICLSQSPQNGWETWFSIAQYGRQLAELRTRVRKVPSEPIGKALKKAEEAANKAALDFKNQKTTPSAMKYAAFRAGMKVYTEQRLHFMKLLSE